MAKSLAAKAEAWLLLEIGKHVKPHLHDLAAAGPWTLKNVNQGLERLKSKGLVEHVPGRRSWRLTAVGEMAAEERLLRMAQRREMDRTSDLSPVSDNREVIHALCSGSGDCEYPHCSCPRGGDGHQGS